MFECRTEKPLSRPAFFRWMAAHILAAAAILLDPVAHRLLHLFHWDETESSRPDG